MRNDLNQVTNLKSLGFKWKRIANLLGVFPKIVLCKIHFHGFFDVAFDSHIFSIVRFVVDCCKTSFICISCCSRWFTSTNPKKLSAFIPPPLPLVLGSLPNSYGTNGCWFLSISPFAMSTKSINDCAISFWAFSLFMIQE